MTNEPPFYLVWNSSGFPPKFRHQTRLEAEAEAERLARVSPGVEFFVLGPLAVMQRQEVDVKRFNLDKIPF